jgi:hypothetical protein
MGGGGTFGFFASFGGNLAFLGVGGINDLRGASERGSRNDCRTSNFSFSEAAGNSARNHRLGMDVERCVGCADSLRGHLAA